MNQVDKELMQEKGILTENEKADEYEIQKAAMKEAVFFLAAMLEKNLDMSELQTIPTQQSAIGEKRLRFFTDRPIQRETPESRQRSGKSTYR